MKIHLQFSEEELELFDALSEALMKANSAPGPHPYEMGGSYGLVKSALIGSLKLGVLSNHPEYELIADQIAVALYSESVSNGENISYQVGLLKDGALQ